MAGLRRSQSHPHSQGEEDADEGGKYVSHVAHSEWVLVLGRALLCLVLPLTTAVAEAAAATAAMLYVADAAVNNCDKKACEFLTNILCIDQAAYPGL